MYESHKANVVNTELSTLVLLTGDDVAEALRICHEGTQGHGGMRKTYKVLCAKYPGHQIPQRLVAEFQKMRHSMYDRFQPLLRANHIEHHRQMIALGKLTTHDVLKTTHLTETAPIFAHHRQQLLYHHHHLLHHHHHHH